VIGGRRLVGLLALGTLLFGAAGLLWSSRQRSCDDTVTAEFRSPGGGLLAAVVDRACGPEHTTLVELRQAGTRFAALAQDFVFAARGKVPVRVLWEGTPEALVVETQARDVLREATHFRKTAVTVRRVR
jgi:hypothetical protein